MTTPNDTVFLLRERVRTLESRVGKYRDQQALHAALYRISETASEAREMGTFYSAIHEIVGELTEARNLFVAALDERGEYVTFQYWGDGEDDEVENECINKAYPIDDFRESLTGIIFRTGEIVHLCRAELEELKESGRVRITGRLASDWLGAPLKQGDEVLGALVVQSYEKEFRYSQRDEELLTYVARHISTVLKRRRDEESLKKAHASLRQANAELQARSDAINAANSELAAMLDDRRRIHQKLIHDARHDGLTGLPNRQMLMERLKSQIDREDGHFALMFLDLDRFKVVNDSLGHLVGDLMLKEAGQRLCDCVGPYDTVARLGGDEFCVLIANESSAAQVMRVASRILEAIAKPFVLESREIISSTSVGVTLSSIGYDSPADVLRDADAALYAAKESGRAKARLFNQQMHEQAVARLQLEQDLLVALSSGQIVPHFQPVVDLQTHQVVSFEALARWEHPRLGLVPPSEFIRIAEDVHAICVLGERILEASLRELAEWRTLVQEPVCLSVNLSSQQLNDSGLPATVKKQLSAAGLPGAALQFEISESDLSQYVPMVETNLSQLAAMGVRFVLDDFGSGIAALGELHEQPLAGIKVDRSIVKEINKNEGSRAIVRTIKALGDVLETSVIAEGIEDECQVDALRELGIRFGQGYLMNAAMPGSEVKQLLLGITSCRVPR